MDYYIFYTCLLFLFKCCKLFTTTLFLAKVIVNVYFCHAFFLTFTVLPHGGYNGPFHPKISISYILYKTPCIAGKTAGKKYNDKV